MAKQVPEKSLWRTRWSKKYGPGFIAYSKKSGRVLAKAREMGKLWDKVVDLPSFRRNELVITHVPQYGVRCLY